MEKVISVALVGNPNCGKTSLFNALTGLNHKVSNFPGTTVEKKIGHMWIAPGIKGEIIDLPGTYSLYPKSADELVTYEILRNKAETNFPDLVIFIADAANLKRNLLLFTQVCDLGVPVILALNMLDVAANRGINYNTEKLRELLGAPVIPINARKKEGLFLLKKELLNDSRFTSSFFNIGEAANENLLAEITQTTDKKNSYAAMQYAINAADLLSEKSERIRQIFEKYKFDARAFQEKEIFERYHLIQHAVTESRINQPHTLRKSISAKVDKILTHRIWGIIIFLLLLLLIFQAIFSWSSYPMELVENLFAFGSNWFKQNLPKGVLSDLVTEGILPGLSGVLVFLPQIIVLFLFIAILEDIGYMARVGFIMDRLMRPFGMNGKSVVPLISGMACAVPSIMASRSIENKRERLITILVTPLMSCSARLPVYTLLISMFIPETMRWGPFNIHGLVLMLMYLLGFGAALFSALIFKLFIKTNQKNFFIMELPGYKMPVASNILITLYEKAGAFVVGAGKIIIAVSVVLWVLASTGPDYQVKQVEQDYEAQLTTLVQKNASETEIKALELSYASKRMEASYAGNFGKFIEPVISPLGFNWKIGIALLTSLAAREVFVGTMSTIYSIDGGEDDLDTIKNKMLAETNPNDGKPTYSLATVFSLLIFYAFALQCMSTVAIVKKETASNKWTIIQFIYLTVLAYGSSLLVFNLFN